MFKNGCLLFLIIILSLIESCLSYQMINIKDKQMIDFVKEYFSIPRAMGALYLHIDSNYGIIKTGFMKNMHSVGCRCVIRSLSKSYMKSDIMIDEFSTVGNINDSKGIPIGIRAYRQVLSIGFSFGSIFATSISYRFSFFRDYSYTKLQNFSFCESYKVCGGVECCFITGNRNGTYVEIILYADTNLNRPLLRQYKPSSQLSSILKDERQFCLGFCIGSGINIKDTLLIYFDLCADSFSSIVLDEIIENKASKKYIKRIYFNIGLGKLFI